MAEVCKIQPTTPAEDKDLKNPLFHTDFDFRWHYFSFEGMLMFWMWWLQFAFFWSELERVKALALFVFSWLTRESMCLNGSMYTEKKFWLTVRWLNAREKENI